MIVICQTPQKQKHQELFDFHALEEHPPMVADIDKRIPHLVERLQHFRKLSGYSKNDEEQCTNKAFLPFFQDVAIVMQASAIVPNKDEFSLKVNIAGTSFRGKSDLFLRRDGEMPILGAELKPMQGSYSLKGGDFSREKFRHRTQVVLQCAAFQSFCRGSCQFSCILTDLNHMYVVQIRSYNASQVSAQIFKCLTQKRQFVRALLHVLDSNSSISKLESSVGHPITIFTAKGYDCNPMGPESGGIPQVYTDTCAAGHTGAVYGANRSHSDADGSLEKSVDVEELGGAETGRKAESSAACFEKLLPSVLHQKSSVKPNFVRAWLHMSTLVDCSNQMNILEDR